MYSKEFRSEMESMSQIELLNFIATFDQYVGMINEVRDAEEDYSIQPVNIEQFYWESYVRLT